MDLFNEVEDIQERLQREEDIRVAYQFDNTLRTAWVQDVKDVFVVDAQSASLWERIQTILHAFFMEAWEREHRPSDAIMDPTRFRLFRANDPALLNSNAAQLVEVYYRVSDRAPTEQDIAFSPWPDKKLGEFYLIYDDFLLRTPVNVTRTLDVQHGLMYDKKKERITDYDAFPQDWAEGKEKARDYLWFPGTNVPVEEMTEQLYRELVDSMVVPNYSTSMAF